MSRLVTLLLAGLFAVVGWTPAAAAPASPDTWGSRVVLDPQFVDAGGVRTAYAALGPESGIPLLLLNGTGSPMAQWDPAFLAALSASRRVVVYDYPGLGQSGVLPGRLTFDGLARHAQDLIEALGHTRADVLGWSMGGFVAQRLAVRAPQRVAGLVLAGTNPGGSHAVLGPDWVQQEDSDAAGTARGYVRANYPRGARSRGWAFVRRVNAAIDSGRYPPDRVPAAAYAAMVDAEDPWLRSDANLADLTLLRVPTLVVTGADDVVTPPANSRLMAATIPGARLQLLEGAGHSFLFQEPRRAARLVLAFLEPAPRRP